MNTQITLARENAGLTLEEAARQARIGIQYLRQVERNGRASFTLAKRLCALYQCRLDIFLYSGGGKLRNSLVLDSGSTRLVPPKNTEGGRKLSPLFPACISFTDCS